MNGTVFPSWIKTGFLYGVIGFMGYMTYNAVLTVTGDPYTAALSIFLFDGGAYSGYQMLVGHAEGAHQRTTAKAILWIDFILAVGMIAGNLDLIAPDMVKWIVVLAAGVNCGALYYYETHDPEVMERGVEQDEQDIQKEAARKNRKLLHKNAMQQAQRDIMRQAPALGSLMALRAKAQLKFDMNLPMTPDELKAWRDDVIDGEELPAPALPDAEYQRGGFSFWDFLARTFGRVQRTAQPATPLQQDAPLSSPEPEPQDEPKQ